MQPPIHRLLPLSLSLIISAPGCSDGGKDTGYSGGAPSDYDGSGGGSDIDDGYGSEQESDFLRLRPASTPKYVFVANAERDTVTRVAIPSLEVITVKVGVRPEVVLTAADYRRAVTLNSGTDDLSIIDAESLTVSTVGVQASLNALALSPDGAWAVAYHNVALDGDGEDEDDDYGAISYSELSLVNLETGEHFEKVVGTFPHDVVFSESGALALVISDDYLSVFDLTDADPDPLRIALVEADPSPPAAEEVLLLPGEQYALVRQYGVDSLLLVDLLAGTTEPLVVGANPTDMDLTPDGGSAVVVARTAGELWLYDAADPRAVPAVVALPPADIYGSILMSPSGEQALLYSTQSGQARYGVWDRKTGAVTTHKLEKPVRSVSVSPRGDTALVFHDQSNGDISAASVFYDEYALTLVDLRSFFSNPILLMGEPEAYADAADGETGYFIMTGQPYLGVLDYGRLSHLIQPLSSAPVYLGVLPEQDTAYINQDHPLGRLSFYDPDVDPAERARLQTITGFELNGAIEQD